jgi:hypothetical protein
MTPLIISCKNSHIDVALYLAKMCETTLNHLDKVRKNNFNNNLY